LTHICINAELDNYMGGVENGLHPLDMSEHNAHCLPFTAEHHAQCRSPARCCLSRFLQCEVRF